MNDFAILILRVTSGAFMLFAHGLPKLNRLISGGEVKFSDPLGIGTIPSLSLTVFAEFFCSALLIIGLFTRPALIVLIITMSVAGFIHHSPDPFIQKEKAFLFLLIFVALYLFGSGKYSLQNLFTVRVKSRNRLMKYLLE